MDADSYIYHNDNTNDDHGDPNDLVYTSYYAYLHRMLAASSSYKIDYNVLSVAAMTLALIMMVEYMRHRLDHWAYHAATTETPEQSKQPLFRAVLEGVYAECMFVDCCFFIFASEGYYASLCSIFIFIY
jgi:hypothetical protein